MSVDKTKFASVSEKFVREKMLKANELSQDILDRYLIPDRRPGELTLSQIYQHLLMTAKNKKTNGQSAIEAVFTSQGTPTWNKFSKMLFDFDPIQVRNTYSDVDSIRDAVKEHLGKEIENNTRAHRYKYCKTILSGANFLARFEAKDGSGDEFYSWIDGLLAQHSPDEVIYILLDSHNRVFGLGDTLIYDFVKELGYQQFGKPDTQVEKILAGLDLIDGKYDTHKTFSVLVNLAVAGGVTPYQLDRILWLIGTGDFYYHQGVPELLNPSGNHSKDLRKKEFVEFVKAQA